MFSLAFDRRLVSPAAVIKVQTNRYARVATKWVTLESERATRRYEPVIRSNQAENDTQNGWAKSRIDSAQGNGAIQQDVRSVVSKKWVQETATQQGERSYSESRRVTQGRTRQESFPARNLIDHGSPSPLVEPKINCQIKLKERDRYELSV